jgi:cytochrome c-type biogenesis protein CcmH
MVLFWFIAVLMILLALWFIVPALLQSSAEAKSDEARTANLLVYQDQLRELEADLKAGLLSEAQYEQDKEELERRLLEDVDDSGRTGKARKKPASRKLAYAIAIAIPVVAVTLYLLLGTPKALNPNVVNPPNMGTR